jgi:DNA helicase HerA-like ATPase
MPETLFLGRGRERIYLRAEMANRHGLVAGATGTGKTVTLRTLAEGFSRIGVPVFMADVKGDLAGLACAGAANPKLAERITQLGLDPFTFEANPVTFWDLLGEQGLPLRATVSDMGPLLLARLLDLNDTQSAVLHLVFKAADQEGLPILDLKDLQAMVQNVGANAKTFSAQFGNIAPATVGAIQRGLVRLGDHGAQHFFGERALAIDDLLDTPSGRGMIHVLAADRLMETPSVYSTFLLWLLVYLL